MSDDADREWYCDKCGGAVAESALVCPHCGDRFDDETAGDPDGLAPALADSGEGRMGVGVSANADDAPDDESWTEFGAWRVVSAADNGEVAKGDEITLGFGLTELVVVGSSGTALDRFPYTELDVRKVAGGNVELRDSLGTYATLRPVGTQRTDALISQLDMIRPRLAPDQPVSIWCPTCGAGATGRADASRVDCVGCGGSILLRSCPRCASVVSIPGEMEGGKVDCPSCHKGSGWWNWDQRPATMGDLAKGGMDAGPNADPDRRHITGSVVASTGFPRMRLGAWCEIDFDEASTFVLVDGPEQDDTPVATIPYSDVRSLSVGGRGAVTTTKGGGWIGGGFGVEGAVEGAVMAQMLNKLTTRSKTTVETLIHLNAGSQDVVLLNEQVTPLVLETRLAPVFRRLEDAHRTPERPAGTTAPIDPLAQLERLAALRDRGIVTPEEFEATKAELLRRLVGG